MEKPDASMFTQDYVENEYLLHGKNHAQPFTAENHMTASQI